MATQVVLLERVEKLGEMGEVVSVKPGYARNYLLPQKKALRATEQNIAYFEAQKKHLQAESDKKKKEAEKVAKAIEGLKVPLVRQASEAGQLYGSVAARDIAAEITKASKQDVDRSMVQLNQNYKLIGLFPVEIVLHPEVKVEVTINIARTMEEAEIQAKTGKALVSEEETDAAAPAETEESEVDETQLEGVLEDSALEAEKEKAEQKKAKAAEAEKKAEEKAAKAAEKQEADSEEPAEEAEAEADKTEE